jgi:hypothetical protein
LKPVCKPGLIEPHFFLSLWSGENDEHLLEAFQQKLGKIGIVTRRDCTIPTTEELSRSPLFALSHRDRLNYASQWQGVRLGHQLIHEQAPPFDLVIRLRTDLYFVGKTRPTMIRELHKLVDARAFLIPATEGHSSLPGELVTDQFLASNWDVFSEYKNFFLPDWDLVDSKIKKQFPWSGIPAGPGRPSIEEALTLCSETSRLTARRIPLPFVICRLRKEKQLLWLKRLEFASQSSYPFFRLLVQASVRMARNLGRLVNARKTNLK